MVRERLTDQEGEAHRLAHAGRTYLWVLRRCGTNLFRLEVCADPVWITYPLETDEKALAWLVQVADDGGHGAIYSITKAEAIRLAHAGYDADADADAVLLAAARASKYGVGPVFRETIEQLVDRDINVQRGITVASNKGLLRWDDVAGLVANLAFPRIG